MKTNDKNVMRNFLLSLFAFAIVLPLTGCPGEKKQRASRSDPASDTMTEENSKDVVVLQNNPAGNSTGGAGGTGKIVQSVRRNLGRKFQRKLL
ncbi:MAG: hypothetical protein IPK01_09815 [Acidobacteria bacterium]|nr:hypothetical protein [Acidobacteriota bacterium]